MADTWAMPQAARATHAPHRARILGLGLSVGIAIALSGCIRPPHQFDDGGREADPIQYHTVRLVLEGKQAGWQRAKLAMTDGLLTNDEYDAIIADGDEAAEREYEASKQTLIAETATPNQEIISGN